MASESYIRQQMADRTKWSPAMHFQELGEIENVKHTFELKLSKGKTAQEKDTILSILERISEEYNLGFDYHAFFHSDGKNTYLVVATKSARFVNGITSIYQKDKIPAQENIFFDIDEAHQNELFRELPEVGGVYIHREHDSIKEERSIYEDPAFMGYEDKTERISWRNLALFPKDAFDGPTR